MVVNDPLGDLPFTIDQRAKQYTGQLLRRPASVQQWIFGNLSSYYTSDYFMLLEEYHSTSIHQFSGIWTVVRK